MRKLLLGTTAVAAASLFGATYASAQEAPTVRIGGYFEFSGAYISDNIDRINPTRPFSRSKVDFRSDLEIVVTVAGKAANGLTYGAQIEMQMDNQPSASGSGIFDTDEAWMFISSPTLGTLQAGDQDSAGNQLAVGPSNFTAGGVGGIFDDFLAGQPSIVTNINDGNDATKIIYLSPQFFGFDFGVSYAPNAGEGERQNVLSGAFQRDKSFLQNEVSGGVRYRGTVGGIGLSASFSGMSAEEPKFTFPSGARINDSRNITAYTAGLSLTAFGLTVAGDYTFGNFSGNSAGRAPLARGRDQSDAYTLGVLYTIGAVRIGGFYGQATQDNGPGVGDRTQTVYGIGADYTLAPGLALFTNLSRLVDKNSPDSTAANRLLGRSRDADVFIVGSRLAF